MRLHILTADNRIVSFVSLITSSAKIAFAKIQNTLEIPDIDFVVYAGSEGTIDYLGIGGRCINKHLVMIVINPSFPGLKKTILSDLKRIIAHESYHCTRNYTYGQKYTLLDSLVNEGLADHYEIELFQSPPQRWDTTLHNDQITQYMEMAKRELHNPTYNHRAWFFGSKEKQIPRWTGYTLGFHLVGRYLKNHPDKKPSNLYDTEVKEFILD